MGIDSLFEMQDSMLQKKMSLMTIPLPELEWHGLDTAAVSVPKKTSCHVHRHLHPDPLTSEQHFVDDIS